MFYASDWSGYLEINRPSWNKGFRGSHDIIYKLKYDNISYKFLILLTRGRPVVEWACFVCGPPSELYIDNIVESRGGGGGVWGWVSMQQPT